MTRIGAPDLLGDAGAVFMRFWSKTVFQQNP